jgi:hypothetical protein
MSAKCQQQTFTREPAHVAARLFRPTVCPKYHSFLGERRYESWLEKVKQGAGDFDACLHSLRHHPLGSCWSRRLLGPSRKGRRGRAIEARLDGDEIASNHFISACLPLRQSQPRSNPLNRGFFRVYLPDEPAPNAVHHSRAALRVWLIGGKNFVRQGWI